MGISVCLIDLLAKINVFKTDNMNYNKGGLVSLEDMMIAWLGLQMLHMMIVSLKIVFYLERSCGCNSG